MNCTGYCRNYRWKMTAEQIERMGCKSEEKQCKHGRKKCKHFRELSLQVSVAERIRRTSF